MEIDKIYSRPRIKLPRIFYYKNKTNYDRRKKEKLRKTTKTLFIVFIAIAFVINTMTAIDPILERLCISEAKNIATMISNEETSKVMEEYSEKELTHVEKDNEGRTQYIKEDIVIINEIMSKISENVQKRLNEKEDSKLYIRLGSFTGIELLSGRGPKIEVVMSSIGHIDTNLRSELSSAGINQTIHRIILDLKCSVTLLTPYKEIVTEIENQIVLAEDIIVGDIPETYYNLEGMTSDDVMEVMQ